MSRRNALLGTLALLLTALPTASQTPKPASDPAAPAAAISPEDAALLKSAEAFVRRLFAWGPEIKVKLGPLTQSPAADYYVVPVEVTLNNQKENGVVYVSKDGKTLLRGEIFDMHADPFADNLSKLHLDGSPSKGPADAKVIVVEFADFECPHCRELYESLQGIEAKYPQVRFVYENFPLTTIHPWAETAAIGARCAYEQSPEAFWKVHNAIFEDQDDISPENVWDKLVSFATQAGLNGDTFKACLSSADAQKFVDAEHAAGVALGVDSTPTVYVNGRPLAGGDPQTLVQYIDFELAAQDAQKK
ncbi:MAG: thioredoxin domain-containing protein [Candidatus Acidiferrales bacterium]